ncbi:MAG: metallophosphoesterase family protein [Saprospiraceae bacterium]|nr:metallophosphoesterase family protein [Saprospiraceae bacterium]
MIRIGLLSDTHGYMGAEIIEIAKTCNEIWHAGDIGNMQVIQDLENIAPVRAVYGNIDGGQLRRQYPENAFFTIEQTTVLMTHIGGYPGRYNSRIKSEILNFKPDLVICGHSHILKVMRDQKMKHLHMNPGAAGNHGFHVMRTMLTFSIHQGKILELSAVEFGKRGQL